MHLEEWNENLRRVCGHYEGIGGGRPGVAGDVALRSMIGGLDVADLSCDLDRIERTRKHIRQDDSEYLFLALQRAGRTVIHQYGKQAVLDAGDLCLIDSTQALTLTFQGEPMRMRSLHVPRGTIIAQSEGRIQIAERLRSTMPYAVRLFAQVDVWRRLVQPGPESGQLPPRPGLSRLHDALRRARPRHHEHE